MSMSGNRGISLAPRSLTSATMISVGTRSICASLERRAKLFRQSGMALADWHMASVKLLGAEVFIINIAVGQRQWLGRGGHAAALAQYHHASHASLFAPVTAQRTA